MQSQVLLHELIADRVFTRLRQSPPAPSPSAFFFITGTYFLGNLREAEPPEPGPGGANGGYRFEGIFFKHKILLVRAVFLHRMRHAGVGVVGGGIERVLSS